MSEYDDNVEKQAQFSIENGEWACNEATKLIEEYKACKTAHAQNRVRQKIEYIQKKLAFEGKELAKLMGEDYGNNIDQF